MQPFCTFRLLVVLVLFVSAVQSENPGDQRPLWNETWTDKLKRDLFLKYDKFARPMQHYNTTTVDFDVSILYITIDEFKSTITVNSWIRQSWSDEKLKWDPEKYGGLKQIHTGNHEVWQPDVTLYNSANTVEYYGDTHCIVYSDGKILWVPPAQLVAFCDLDLRLWPFDTQTCFLKFGSWTHHGGQIDIQLNTPAAKPELLVEHGEWKLMDIKRERVITHYECCEEPYILLTFTLFLKRNSILYYSILMTPATTVVFLTLVTFWLQPQSEMKVTVAACTTLIIAVFLVYFGLKVPLTTSPPLVVYFYSGCLCQVTISLVLAVLVINMSRRPYCKPLPRNVRLFLLSWPGKMLGLSDLIAVIESRRPMPGQELRGKLTEESTAANSTSNISDDCDRQNILSPTKNTTQLEWVLAATAIDRAAFLLFCIILGTMAILCMS